MNHSAPDLDGRSHKTTTEKESLISSDLECGLEIEGDIMAQKLGAINYISKNNIYTGKKHKKLKETFPKLNSIYEKWVGNGVYYHVSGLKLSYSPLVNEYYEEGLVIKTKVKNTEDSDIVLSETLIRASDSMECDLRFSWKLPFKYLGHQRSPVFVTYQTLGKFSNVKFGKLTMKVIGEIWKENDGEPHVVEGGVPVGEVRVNPNYWGFDVSVTKLRLPGRIYKVIPSIDMSELGKIHTTITKDFPDIPELEVYDMILSMPKDVKCKYLGVQSSLNAFVIKKGILSEYVKDVYSQKRTLPISVREIIRYMLGDSCIRTAISEH